MALNNQQLDVILKGNVYTKRYFYGSMPACRAVQIPKRRKFTFITNTDNHSNGGRHWNAWAVDNGKVYFFDSFGRSPMDNTFPHVYKDIVLNFKSFSFFNRQVQTVGPESFTCGYFCIHFILNFSIGLDMTDLLKDYTVDTKKNDVIVLNIIKSII